MKIVSESKCVNYSDDCKANHNNLYGNCVPNRSTKDEKRSITDFASILAGLQNPERTLFLKLYTNQTNEKRNCKDIQVLLKKLQITSQALIRMPQLDKSVKIECHFKNLGLIVIEAKLKDNIIMFNLHCCRNASLIIRKNLGAIGKTLRESTGLPHGFRITSNSTFRDKSQQENTK